MKRKNANGRRPSRLGRIERKCDIILSELLMLRSRKREDTRLDDVIDRMHATARRMRRQCTDERDRMNDFLND